MPPPPTTPGAQTRPVIDAVLAGTDDDTPYARPYHPPSDLPRRASPPLGARAANALVFLAAGAVLVLEILGVRLLAPYVGLTLETTTAIIGAALAGIAAGAAAGGRAADRFDGRWLLPLLLAAGGLLCIAAVPLVRTFGDGGARHERARRARDRDDDPVPAGLRAQRGQPGGGQAAAARPRAHRPRRRQPVGVGHRGRAGRDVRHRLRARPADADERGGVRDRRAAAGRRAALALRFGVGSRAIAAACVAGAITLAGLALAIGSPCDTESDYHCAAVAADPARSGGRTLILDDLRHSYVDLDDLGHLEFDYTRWMGDAIDALPAGPLDAVYLGGGGYTLPRYVATTRPGSRARVLEVDGELVDLARRRLALRTGRRCASASATRG